MICSAKHTKYQPTDEEWRCPKCGADNKGFWIDELDPDAHDECPLLHERETLVCHSCPRGDMFSTSGKAFAAKLAKKNNMIPCPHCKGRGMVKKP